MPQLPGRSRDSSLFEQQSKDGGPTSNAFSGVQLPSAAASAPDGNHNTGSNWGMNVAPPTGASTEADADGDVRMTSCKRGTLGARDRANWSSKFLICLLFFRQRHRSSGDPCRLVREGGRNNKVKSIDCTLLSLFLFCLSLPTAADSIQHTRAPPHTQKNPQHTHYTHNTHTRPATHRGPA